MTLKCYRVILGFVSSNCQLVSVSITVIFYCKAVLIFKLSRFSVNQSNFMYGEWDACIHLWRIQDLIVCGISYFDVRIVFIGPEITMCGNLIVWEYEMEWLKQSRGQSEHNLLCDFTIDSLLLNKQPMKFQSSNVHGFHISFYVII